MIAFELVDCFQTHMDVDANLCFPHLFSVTVQHFKKEGKVINLPARVI